MRVSPMLPIMYRICGRCCFCNVDPDARSDPCTAPILVFKERRTHKRLIGLAGRHHLDPGAAVARGQKARSGLRLNETQRASHARLCAWLSAGTPLVITGRHPMYRTKNLGSGLSKTHNNVRIPLLAPRVTSSLECPRESLTCLCRAGGRAPASAQLQVRRMLT
jgi:hypothetical protein